MLPSRLIFGEPSLDTRSQPVRSMGALPGLKSSIHSSDELAEVPAQETSLIMIVSSAKFELLSDEIWGWMATWGAGVIVGDCVNVLKRVDVAEFVLDGVGVAVGVVVTDGIAE